MINWKLRLQNKTTLTALLVGVVALVYQLLGLFGVVPSVSQDEMTNTVGMVVNVLVLMGIVVDPTTKGFADSQKALEYSVLNDGKIDTDDPVNFMEDEVE